MYCEAEINILKFLFYRNHIQIYLRAIQTRVD